jgi:asparagine synthase (glutamine-hydrolysing)
MCGIVAFCSEEQRVEPALLSTMTDSLAHRGPDDRGTFITRDSRLGLGHRRLSILDPTPAGRQPMSDASGRYTLVYNGEVYDFKDTRERLRELGHAFRSDSDTEVVLHAFMEWGPACLEHLAGMFAFAIWDAREERLFAARDRLGIKPLYYYWDGSTAILASELRAILASPLVSRQVNVSAVRDFLVYGYVPDPRSILKNVYKLRAGHHLSVAGRELRVTRYWDVDFGGEIQRSEADWQDRILGSIDRAVREQLVSDVPLGAFLSGGVDSSTVVSSMVASGVEKPNVFCVGFEEARFSEIPHARRVADALGVDLVEKIVTAESLDRDLEMLAEVHDEPFGDQSALPTSHLCKATREEVTVALSGDGGDENFGGYGAFVAARDRMLGRHRFRPKTLVKRARSLLRAPGARFFSADWESADPVEYFCRRSGHWAPEFVRRLVPGETGGEDPFWAYRQEMQEGLGPIEQILRISLKTVLPGRMLTKVDRASMAHGLEVRVPLLDHRLVDLCATIPIGMKIQGGEGKVILKKAIEGRIPKENIYRAKKGFTPPLREWLAEEPVFERVRSSILEGSLVRDLFDEQVLRSFLASPSNDRAFAKCLWDLIALDHWSRRWM